MKILIIFSPLLVFILIFFIEDIKNDMWKKSFEGIFQKYLSYKDSKKEMLENSKYLEKVLGRKKSRKIKVWIKKTERNLSKEYDTRNKLIKDFLLELYSKHEKELNNLRIEKEALQKKKIEREKERLLKEIEKIR